MQFDNFSLPLNEADKLLIIEAISNAHNKDLLDFMNEYQLETYNALNMLKWDFTNTNLIRNLDGDNFQCFKVKRGPWKFILLYHPSSKFLYSLMKENRFNVVLDRKNREKVHYVDALVSANQNVRVEECIKRDIQMNLFDIGDSEWESAVNKVFEELVHTLGINVKTYVLITFKMDKNIIETISAKILTPNLEVAYHEDWSDLIPAHYDTNTLDLGVENNDDEFEDIPLVLRDGVIPHEKDNFVQLRENEEIEKDGEE
jgi:hypothetical protein